VNNEDLNTLFDGLSSFSMPSVEAPKEKITLKDEEVNQYVLDKSKSLIETGLNAVQDLASYVTQGQNPDEIAALAELMNATSKAIEALNRVNLIDRKADRDEKLKRIDIEGKKELISLSGPQNVTNNMNVLVASREEIMKRLFGNGSEQLEIDNK
jgi:hypothetical protein